MGRRKVINNLWMKSNKRLKGAGGGVGEGPVRWVHVSVILRWLPREDVLQKRCRNYAKKNQNICKQTWTAKAKHRKTPEPESREPKMKFQIRKHLRRKSSNFANPKKLNCATRATRGGAAWRLLLPLPPSVSWWRSDDGVSTSAPCSSSRQAEPRQKARKQN